MSSPKQMTPLDLEGMREGGVYLSLYPKWPKILKGYFRFTVSKISGHHMLVIFRYAVRGAGGKHEMIKGDEPSILFQDPRSKLWTHYGATARGVPIQVGKLEGARLAKYEREMDYRKEWLKTHPLPPTKYPMGSDLIKDIEEQIRALGRQEVQH